MPGESDARPGVDDAADRGDGPGRGVPDRLSRPPWRSLLRDLAFVAAWVAMVSFAWAGSGWPEPAYFAVAFGGILAYSVVSALWTEYGDSPG